MKQLFQSAQHGKTGPIGSVGDGKGNKTGVLPRQVAENRLNMGRININVRGHDDDVFWGKLRTPFEQVEQLVLQNFHFPLAAVGHLESDGPILWGYGRFFFMGPGQWRQIKNRLLHPAQQGGIFLFGGKIVKQVNFFKALSICLGAVVSIQETDIVPALFPPGSQKRINRVVQRFRTCFSGVPGMGKMADLFKLQQFTVFHDVSPVEPAGVVYKKQHLAVPTECM